MEQNKNLNIILYIILGLLVANFIYSFFGMNKNLKDTLKLLEQANSKLQTASDQLKGANAKINDIQTDLSKYNAYIHDVQGRVEMMDMERKLNDAKYSSMRDSIKTRIADIKKDIDFTGDNLPPIEEVVLK